MMNLCPLGMNLILKTISESKSREYGRKSIWEIPCGIKNELYFFSMVSKLSHCNLKKDSLMSVLRIDGIIRINIELPWRISLKYTLT